jgi:hypothetical protein
MEILGTSLEGVYGACPPPGISSSGFGFKKLKRGLKKAGKGAYKLNKRVVKTTIKLHTAPLKAVAKAGKFAMKGMAKLAAKPIIKVVNKLAGRRAAYIAFQRTGVAKPTLADKKKGGQYALGKIAKAGPVGKLVVRIIKFAGGVTSGGSLMGAPTRDLSGWKRDAAMCGMAPAAIVAAIPPIMVAINKLMKGLNKPGEAPANPETPTTVKDAATDTQPVLESDDAQPSAETEQAEESSTEEEPAADDE